MPFRKLTGLTFVIVYTCAGLSAGVSLAQDVVRLRLVPQGWSERIGHYTPQRVELSATRPESIQRVPDGIADARYGILPFRGLADAPGIAFILDETRGRGPRLWVDANGNRDLSDDAPVEWQEKRVAGPDKRELVHFTGYVSLPLRTAPGEPRVGLGLYRFDANDPANRQHAGALFCYADYGFDGTITIAGTAYRVALADDAAAGVFRNVSDSSSPACSLLIDLDSDGRLAPDKERFDIRKAIEILGGSFEVSELAPGAEQFTFVTRRSPAKVAAAPGDVGTAKPFEARTLDGKAVRFPEDYKGKLVLLDFWATWCRPCIAEVPTLVQAHEKFAESGFTILGVSLDGQAALEKLPAFAERNKMNWPHICDGLGWNSRLGKLYEVRSIPRAFLVDGDTGAIVATGSEVRGPNLLRAIESALGQRSKRKDAP